MFSFLKKLLKNLQIDFLTNLKVNKIPVSVFLKSGIKLDGIIEDFDSRVIILKDQVSQMIYKNAISTVCPKKRR